MESYRTNSNKSSTTARTNPPTIKSTHHRSNYSQMLSQLNMLIAHAHDEKKMVKHLIKELTEYAKLHFEKIGNEYIPIIPNQPTYFQKITSTKPERATAVNFILDVAHKSSAADIYEQLISPYIQKLIGQDEIQFHFLRKHLVTIIEDFKRSYQLFNNINNAESIKALLLNDDIKQEMTPKHLSMLFWYYQPMLVADIILNHYHFDSLILRDDTLQFEVDLIWLEQLLAGNIDCINLINCKRAQNKASQILLQPAKTPGKNLLNNEELSNLELYQYDENVISAVEYYFCQTYHDIFANHIKYQGSFLPKKELTPYYFYFISATPYILVDYSDTNNLYYDRFQLFKKHIQELVASYYPLQETKPIIFCGMINLDGNHYLPYFIFKNKINQIIVKTIDPSPQLSPVDISSSVPDSKYKTFLKLKRIFEHIFPGCSYEDLSITQMLRERDCGPNAATSLKDAFSTTFSATPLIQIVADNLVINSAQLSVQAKPIGINYYTNTFFYPASLAERSLTNRLWWKEQLSYFTQVATLTVRHTETHEQAYSINDIYDLADQCYLEFSYIEQAQNQDHQDALNTKISTVQSYLLEQGEGLKLYNNIINEFKNTLKIPKSKPLVMFIKNKIKTDEVFKLLFSANENMTDLANDVIVHILREPIILTLKQLFEDKLENLNISVELKLADIVESFLAEHIGCINTLHYNQKRTLIESLYIMGKEKLKIEFKIIYEDAINQFFQQNFIYCYAKIPADVPKELISKAIIPLLKDPLVKKSKTYINADIEQAIIFMYENYNHDLIRIIDNNIQKATAYIDKLINDRMPIYIQNLNFSELVSALNEDKLIDHCKNIFISIEKELIKNKNINMLSQANLLSFLLHNRIKNITLFNTFKHLILFLHAQIQKIFIANNLSNVISIKPIHEIFLLNQSKALLNQLINDIQLSNIIENQIELNSIFIAGKPQFVINLINNIAENELQMLLTTALHAQYQLLAKAILHANYTFQFDESLVDIGSDPLEVVKRYYERALKNPTFNTEILSPFVSHQFDNQTQITLPQQFNLLGKDFSKWFVHNKMKQFQKQRDRHAIFKSNIDYIQNFVCSINNYISTHNIKLDLIDLSDEIALLKSKTIELLLCLEMETEESDRFQLLEKQFIQIIHHLCIKAYKYLEVGDLKPGSMSALLRPILCQLLNIETPCILKDKTEAIGIDQAINKRIKLVQLAPVAERVFKTKLLMLEIQHNRPPSYGVLLSKSLLVKCVSYWFTESNSKSTILESLLNRKPTLAIKSLLQQEQCPKLIEVMIDIINDNANTEADIELKQEDVLKIKYWLKIINQHHLFGLDLHQDLLKSISICLQNTRSLNEQKPTTLNFALLDKIFGLTEQLIKNSFQPQNNEVIIQNTLRSQIREMRKLNPQAEINIFELQAAIKLRLSNTTSINMLPSFTNVVPARLNRLKKQTSFFKGKFTNLEKLLLTIQKKHDNAIDFYLDQEDIAFVSQELCTFWNKCSHNKERNYYLFSRFCTEMDRETEVYIAMAEILSKSSREQGMKISYFDYLMPTIGRLKSYELPPIIFDQLGLPSEENHVDLIPLKKLVITRSGYAFNIDWLIDNYVTKNQLINLYTQNTLTPEEIKDILAHDDTIEIIKQFSNKNKRVIIPQAIHALRDYLNAAIFDSGFSSDYSTVENDMAFNAYTHFNLKLTKLPYGARNGLLSEIIPGYDSTVTVQSTFKESEKNCLTIRGVKLARVVIAYERNNHGLINKNLVDRAYSQPIAPREYQAVDNIQDKLYSTPEEELLMTSKKF